VILLLDPSIGPVRVHPAVERTNEVYRESGVAVPQMPDHGEAAGSLVIAPPWARGTSWMRQFRETSTAFASGWMRIRGTRRRRSLDRGFAISDHADWPALLTAIDNSGAETVLATHGYTAPLIRWLREQGRNAEALETRFGDELEPEPGAEVGS
jgi:putative mRNA 3-end processing factor